MGRFEREPIATFRRLATRLERRIHRAPENLPLDLRVVRTLAATHPSPLSSEEIAFGLFGLANCFRDLGRQRAAAALYAKTVELSLPFANVHRFPLKARYNLGNYHLRRREYRAAETWYRSALELNPNEYLPNVNLCAALREMGRWREGLEVLAIALLEHPKEPLAYDAAYALCSDHRSFSGLVDALTTAADGNTDRRSALGLVLERLPITYRPVIPRFTVSVKGEPTGDLGTDLARARLLADLVDGVSTAIHSPPGFDEFMNALDSLENRAEAIQFFEVAYYVNLARGYVWGGYVLSAFSWPTKRGGEDLCSEFLAFKSLEVSAGRILSDDEYIERAMQSFESALHLVISHALADRINRSQLSTLVGNLMAAALRLGDAERCMFLIDCLRQEHRGIREVEEVLHATRIGTLRAKLGSGEALVVMYVVEVFDDRVVLVVLDRKTVRVDSFPLHQNGQTAESVRWLIEGHTLGWRALPEELEGRLFKQVVLKILEVAREARHLIIVPFSVLRNLPWEIIGGHESLGETDGGRSVRYLTHLGAFRSERWAIPRNTAIQVIASSCDGELDVHAEIERISRRLAEVKGGQGRVIRSELGATRSPNARFVHLACHAEFDETRSRPALMLPGAEEGIERGFEWEGAHVFLNACASGRDVLDGPHGDWFFGIAASLLDRGARTVVATRWPVLDTDAIEMADLYYGFLFGLEGDCAEALRWAQRSLATQFLRGRDVWGSYFVLGARYCQWDE